MALDLNGPAEIVEDKYARSVALAEAANREAAACATALANNFYKPGQIDVRWQTLAAPNLPPIPDLPQLPNVTFDEPEGMPGSLMLQMDDVQIDSFEVTPPELNFGQAPTLNIGQAPALPEVRDVAVPDAPDVLLPDAPQFLQLQTHTFGGVNLHEDWLEKLDDIPTLSVLRPAPFQHTPGAKYASQLLDNLKASLNARIQGGSGIAPAVEQQIWDRARDRETALALAREQEVLRGAEALGFPLPSGALAGQLADARREFHDKLSGLSRDVAIKQAEMEQQNVKDAITQALQLETTLLDDAYKLEMLAFETAKTTADNALAAFNAAVEHYKALLAGYQAYAAAYDTVIRAELNKVDVYKAMLEAEKTKADINKSLVDRYRAEIDGSMAVVESTRPAWARPRPSSNWRRPVSRPAASRSGPSWPRSTPRPPAPTCTRHRSALRAPRWRPSARLPKRMHRRSVPRRKRRASSWLGIRRRLPRRHWSGMAGKPACLRPAAAWRPPRASPRSLWTATAWAHRPRRPRPARTCGVGKQISSSTRRAQT
ncbi:hypothetical protein [Delftia lacustris]|uniref:hypothetical protein n=1 Tax=Delftia lacustris TaxID=558537 RepID=UPI000AEB7E93|nr:hypothetical protein [Delftia lacustris]